LLFEFDSDELGKIVSVSWVYLVNVAAESFLDVLSTLAERARKICDYVDAVLLTEDLVVENSRLFVVGVRVLVRVSAD
jgi:hypothetical protein